MAHAQEGKRSMRRKLAQSKRPVRKTGAAERDVVENADTEQPKYVKEIAPTTALTDAATEGSQLPYAAQASTCDESDAPRSGAPVSDGTDTSQSSGRACPAPLTVEVSTAAPPRSST